MHGVFPSSRKYSASSRKFQFHWDCTRDSRIVVTPFMQDTNQMPRHFATLGPSELQPPFTGISNKSLNFYNLYLQHRAGVSLYTSFYKFAETCVFNKQSLSSFLWQQFKIFYKIATLYSEVTELFCRVPSV